MRKKEISEIEEGDTVAIDIYDRTGTVLLKQGSKINWQNAGRLKAGGIPFVYVEGGEMKVSTVFGPPVMAGLLRVIWYFTATGGSNGEILKRYNVEEIKRFEDYNSETAGKIAYGHIFRYFINEMIRELKAAKDKYYDFTDYRNVDTYLHFHAAGAASLCLLIAGGMGMPDREIEELGVGAVLYDLKMGAYKFVQDSRELDEVEKEEMRQHAYLSFDAARRIYGIPAASASVAYQHHERQDGSGYPRGLRGENINMLSRIAAAADVYDSLASHRPHRRAYMPDEAWNYIVSNGGLLFDEKVTAAFARTVAKFRPGDEVEVSGGRAGMVLRNNASDMERPVIKLIEKKSKSDIISGAVIDLSREKNMSVVKTVKSVR
jgi:HD-GYP domain-containing protein (c-di-GMP phosphodiesterase class II)